MGIEGVDDVDGLRRRLETMGYANTGELDGPGTFCMRGGSVDVFPGNSDFPVRLDFFGDDLDEIRRVIPSTGQMVSSLESIDVYPVSELPVLRRGHAGRAEVAREGGAHQQDAPRRAGEDGRGP